MITEQLKKIQLLGDTEFLNYIKYLRLDHRHDSQILIKYITNRLATMNLDFEIGCCGENMIFKKT